MKVNHLSRKRDRDSNLNGINLVSFFLGCGFAPGFGHVVLALSLSITGNMK